MKISVLKERRDKEKRVALSPQVVKKLTDLGFEILIETGAGEGSHISDREFEDAGARIVPSLEDALKESKLIVKVQCPETSEIELFKRESLLVCSLNAFTNKKEVEALAKAGVISFAMDFMPRTSRAQSMDILSSQSNLAGYKAVIDTAAEFSRAFPMMMTSAGTVPPARVLVLGAGVAGLQAIATAKRLGAVVYAFDVRPAVKEQVESLGGRFVQVKSNGEESGETKSGYAKDMSADYKARQREALCDELRKADIVICTAQIFGKSAPILIDSEMLSLMKAGSIVFDLAIETGGNCSESVKGEVIEKNGVKVMAPENIPSQIAGNASSLYANNIFNFLKLLFQSLETAEINWKDELVKGTCVTKDGAIVHELILNTMASMTSK